MNTCIALFRGINVGGKHILPMKELKNILESLNYRDVQTYIQSGNVVFRSDDNPGEADAGKISREILRIKGFEPRVLLMSSGQLVGSVNNNPFPTDNGKALHFYFLLSEPDEPDLDRLMNLKSEAEQYSLIKNVFYLYAPDGIGRSRLASAVEKVLGVPATARNWNTISRLLKMVEIV